MYNLYFLACLLWDLSSFVSLISDDEDEWVQIPEVQQILQSSNKDSE